MRNTYNVLGLLWFHRKVTSQMVAFLCFCLSVLDRLSQSGLWDVGYSGSPGVCSRHLGICGHVAASPCGQDNCCKEAASLSLSQAGREMSCVLPEAGLPTCCCGPAPLHWGPGGAGMGVYCPCVF